jgi:hypothetical protein
VIQAWSCVGPMYVGVYRRSHCNRSSAPGVGPMYVGVYRLNSKRRRRRLPALAPCMWGFIRLYTLTIAGCGGWPHVCGGLSFTYRSPQGTQSLAPCMWGFIEHRIGSPPVGKRWPHVCGGLSRRPRPSFRQRSSVDPMYMGVSNCSINQQKQ